MKLLENIGLDSALIMLKFMDWYKLELEVVNIVEEIKDDNEVYTKIYNLIFMDKVYGGNIVLTGNIIKNKNKASGLYLKVHLNIDSEGDYTCSLIPYVDKKTTDAKNTCKCDTCMVEITDNYYVKLEGLAVYSPTTHDSDTNTCLSCAVKFSSYYKDKLLDHISYLKMKNLVEQLTDDTLKFLNEMLLVPKVSVRDFKNTGYLGINMHDFGFNSTAPTYTKLNKGLRIANDKLETPHLFLLNGVISIFHTTLNMDTPVKIIHSSGDNNVVALLAEDYYDELVKYKETGGKL